jgi:hypothetical protein
LSDEGPVAKGKEAPVYAKALKLLSLPEPAPSNPAFALPVERLTRN